MKRIQLCLCMLVVVVIGTCCAEVKPPRHEYLVSYRVVVEGVLDQSGNCQIYATNFNQPFLDWTRNFLRKGNTNAVVVIDNVMKMDEP